MVNELINKELDNNHQNSEGVGIEKDDLIKETPIDNIGQVKFEVENKKAVRLHDFENKNENYRNSLDVSSEIGQRTKDKLDDLNEDAIYIGDVFEVAIEIIDKQKIPVTAENISLERRLESLPPEKSEKLIKEILIDIEKNRQDLGEGMSSQVFTTGDKKFCIKKISIDEESIKSVGGNSIEIEFDYQERASLLGIRTPTPIAVFDTSKQEKFFIMETITGHTLKYLLKEPSKTPKEFNAEQSISKLKYFIELMEKNNINHGDLKSRNIMIDKNGELVIIDWGLASSKNEIDARYEEKEKRRAKGEFGGGIGKRLDSKQLKEITELLTKLQKKI